MNKKSIFSVIILFLVFSITVGFSAFASEMSISKIVVDVRVKSDIRITGIGITGGSMSGSYDGINFDVDSIMLGDLVKNKGDYVELAVTITNFESEEMGIYDVIVPEGIDFEISNYDMESKICDDSGKCNLGISKTLNFKVTNRNCIDINESINMDFVFRKFYSIKYIGLSSGDYPTEIIDGETLSIEISSSVPIYLGVRDKNGKVPFSYTNGMLTVSSISNDLEVEVGYISEWRYDYVYGEQSFTAPNNATYRIQLWGAQGGGNSSFPGGLGAYTSGKIKLKKGETIYIHTGQMGGDLTAETYNNGFISEYVYWGDSSILQGTFYSGGGSTDVRLVSGNWDSFEGIKSRIMVAAGGGGTMTYYGGIGTAGDGGGLVGYDGTINSGTVGRKSTGGTQTSGGLNGIINSGSAWFGSAYYVTGMTQVAGGGGGYYAGGNGAHGSNTVGSGAGGSSFVSGHDGCNAISDASTESNIIHTGQSIHYSGYKFTDTYIIDGRGYIWTNTIGEYNRMPTHHGGTSMVGNEGNGYAKINLIEIN